MNQNPKTDISVNKKIKSASLIQSEENEDTINKVLLIVDDNTSNRRVLAHILGAAGYETAQAADGQQALELLKSKKEEIGLILLDLKMPVMDGYELLRRMNENGLISSIPVIVTTGSEDENAEIRSLDFGASDFLTKPYNAELVCHRVRSLLRLFGNASLLNQLETDKLTGVYSAEFFYHHVQTELEKHPDTQYEIVCSNIERFKLINAKHGTSVGDELLKYVARKSKEYVEGTGFCGRVGPDVFAQLREFHKDRWSQAEVAKLFNDTYKDAPVDNFMMQYGIYPITDKTIPVSDMCDRAQMAIASIKHKFGVYYEIYDDSFRQKLMREYQLNDYKEDSLAKNQFLVYLQPKHNTVSGKLCGAEALVRWVHPELGLIPPVEFIPFFEQNGFITKLDRYVWEQVCQILSRWQKEGRKLIPISVNASRANFSQENLPEVFADLVDEYDIPIEMLHIEVTESAYTDNPQQIISAVNSLRSLGFKIEMDDFGSGYSSLNMLSELSIDILKLDMKFMQVGESQMTNGKRSILSFVLSLSKWLQLSSVAEGVETKEEVNLLRTMGCNYIQGYVFAKPMAVDQFEKYWEECEREDEQIDEAQTPQKVEENEPVNENSPLILIVEDIAANREALKQILSPYYRIEMTTNGEEAHDYITQNEDKISCILLDLLMPVMDGFELLNLLSKEGVLDKIPVIITSEVGTDSELRALHIGADDFASKPYNRELLLHHVKRSVGVRKLRLLNEPEGEKD